MISSLLIDKVNVSHTNHKYNKLFKTKKCLQTLKILSELDDADTMSLTTRY